MVQQELSLQTRNESWDRIQSVLSERQAEVYQLLRAAPAGLTAWQIAHKLDRPVYVVRPRLTELKKGVFVHAIGKRFFDGTKRLEAVWKLID